LPWVFGSFRLSTFLSVFALYLPILGGFSVAVGILSALTFQALKIGFYAFVLPFFRPGLPWFFRLWFFRLCLLFSVRLLSWFFRRFPAVDRLRLFHLALFGGLLPWWILPALALWAWFSLGGFSLLGVVSPCLGFLLRVWFARLPFTVSGF
jgi:hypothetical protein